MYFNSSCAQNISDTSDSTFLRWKADTLKLIKSQPHQNTDRLIRYYHNDSSVIFTELHLIDEEEYFLEEINYYKCKIKVANIKTIKDNSISRVLDLLKDYKEMPNKDFVLSFKNVISYYASEIPNRKYSFVEDIKDITVEVKNENKILKYEYNKGSLSSKVEIISISKKMKQPSY